MDFHQLLVRQLQKMSLSEDEVPSLEQWQAFLYRVNKVYIESDQERYLQERSMKISSNEMMALNARLEYAQKVARLGYWSYDGINDVISWSHELYFILDLDPLKKPLNHEALVELVHPQDLRMLESRVNKALTKRQNYSCDLRLKVKKTYRWFRMIAECQKEEKQLSGILMDIHNAKVSEEKIKELNQRLVQTARQAGMAEIASMVLHNVGNILNSAFVSVDILKTQYEAAYYQKLFKILYLIEENKDDLERYLSQDVKGQLIPEYLSTLVPVISESFDKEKKEANNLLHHLDQIKRIVAMQKSISGVSSLLEEVYVPALIDSALSIALSRTDDLQLHVVKEFQHTSLIWIDKSKLLQILINLIQNARDAVFSNKEAVLKEIKIQIQTDKKEDRLKIILTDNGVGMSADALAQLFTFGYTTKAHGHGFGLHSSAISAKEMGGTLEASSLGKGKGTVFTLCLPMRSARSGLKNSTSDTKQG